MRPTRSSNTATLAATDAHSSKRNDKATSGVKRNESNSSSDLKRSDSSSGLRRGESNNSSGLKRSDSSSGLKRGESNNSSGLKRSDSRRSFTDETSGEDEDSEMELGFNYGHRQKRLRSIDLNKEVLVLRPRDDYESILDLREREIDEFIDVIQSNDDLSSYLFEGRKVRDEPLLPSSKPSTVFTPSVVPTKTKLPLHPVDKVAAFFKKNKQLAKNEGAKPATTTNHAPALSADPQTPRGRGRPRIYPINPLSSQALAAQLSKAAADAAAAAAANSSKGRIVNYGERVNKTSYTVYDADDDDEEFLNALKKDKSIPPSQKLSIEEFELMMAVLERALDSAKELLPTTSKFMGLKNLCSSFIQESNSVASIIDERLYGPKKGDGKGSSFVTSEVLAGAGSKSSTSAKSTLKRTESSASVALVGSQSVHSSVNTIDSPEGFTREELAEMVPENRALYVLGVVTASANDTLKPSEPFVPNPVYRNRSLKVYNHWLDKRAGTKCSFIRVYHNFMMEHWKRQDIIPKIPEDANEAIWKSSRQQLLRVRADLDRARLIMDRVRRREKVKRELNIAAIDAFDGYITSSSSTGKVSRDLQVTPLPFSIEHVDPDDPEIAERDPGFRNSFTSLRTVEANFGSDILSASQLSAHGWSPLEDKLLLLGVAAYGVGSWLKIRELFRLSKSSVFMSQRFQRLTRQRQIKQSTNGSRDSSVCKLGIPAVICDSDSGLSANIQRFVNSFTDESIWEGVAIRHVLETRSPEKRCGRPSKFPVRVPIPAAVSILDPGKLLEKGNKYIYDPTTSYIDISGIDKRKSQSSAFGSSNSSYSTKHRNSRAALRSSSSYMLDSHPKLVLLSKSGKPLVGAAARSHAAALARKEAESRMYSPGVPLLMTKVPGSKKMSSAISDSSSVKINSKEKQPDAKVATKSLNNKLTSMKSKNADKFEKKASKQALVEAKNQSESRKKVVPMKVDKKTGVVYVMSMTGPRPLSGAAAHSHALAVARKEAEAKAKTVIPKLKVSGSKKSLVPANDASDTKSVRKSTSDDLKKAILKQFPKKVATKSLNKKSTLFFSKKVEEKAKAKTYKSALVLAKKVETTEKNVQNKALLLEKTSKVKNVSKKSALNVLGKAVVEIKTKVDSKKVDVDSSKKKVRTGPKSSKVALDKTSKSVSTVSKKRTRESEKQFIKPRKSHRLR